VAERVVLHVGLMKSGTSYIQSRLVAAPEALAAQGVLFPGSVWRDQVVAISDGLGRTQRAAGDFDGAWGRMVRTINDHDGVAVISMEFLAAPGPDKLRPIVEAFADTPVEAIITIRDLGRTIPSMWQETLKNGRSSTWADYVEDVRRHGGATNFWHEQDAARIVETWVGLLGAEATSVVTLPRDGSNPELLWERFCEAARIPTAAAPAVPSSNESLGAASSQLLRQINLALGDVPWPAYSHVVKFGLSKSLLADHRAAEPAIGFNPRRWVRAEARRIGSALEASGARVVGDLADLEPRRSEGVDPDRISVADPSGAAVHALVQLLNQGLERYAAEGER
jgi:hypothetical protein